MPESFDLPSLCFFTRASFSFPKASFSALYLIAVSQLDFHLDELGIRDP